MKRIIGIKHVFFDLDRTLWDFEKNSETIIQSLLITYDVERLCNTNADTFIKTYKKINHKLWHLYSHKKITKEELRSSRFNKTLEKLGVKNAELGLLLEEDYIKQSPYQTKLLEGAIEVLEYLKSNYTLHIISNGFKEVQYIKLHASGIKEYFMHIFISEEIGFQKPAKEIFHVAQTRALINPAACVMIGDDFTNDIRRSPKCRLESYLPYRNKKRIKHPDMYQIKSLLELKDLL